jgi:hypothetical protein
MKFLITPIALTQRNSVRYPLERRLGRPQSRSGRCPCRESNTGRPDRRQLLYRLRYSGSFQQPEERSWRQIWGKMDDLTGLD